jgi:hypothetical protein
MLATFQAMLSLWFIVAYKYKLNNIICRAILGYAGAHEA